MKTIGCAILVLFSLALMGQFTTASAGSPQRHDRWALRFARTQAWHGGYYHTAWGQPIALVVPPTAQMQTRMGWGVSQNTMTPIYHQFRRPYPGDFEGGGENLFSPTPQWPSHTDQFGVYYIRGPW